MCDGWALGRLEESVLLHCLAHHVLFQLFLYKNRAGNQISNQTGVQTVNQTGNHTETDKTEPDEIWEVRERLGEQLAMQDYEMDGGWKADLVIYVPNSSKDAAKGYSNFSGIPTLS